MILNVLFVHTLGFGFIGAAYASGISYNLSFVLLAGAIPFTRARATWGGFDRRAFQHTLPFAKLAIPGVLQTLAEWAALEGAYAVVHRLIHAVVSLQAGRLGRVPLAAHSIVQTMDSLMFTHVAANFS